MSKHTLASVNFMHCIMTVFSLEVEYLSLFAGFSVSKQIAKSGLQHRVYSAGGWVIERGELAIAFICGFTPPTREREVLFGTL